ncbi:MAG: molybdopterin converting factor subunit 1 [Marinicaulis sp.]|nr:molybdopterin converting factor subunit 1 [Marinicaulis sp.]NNE40926.1 molybdopterin converting factor subunit 1 [Marinicaulis sp.]NNL89209.1 molybdopterin converting factor subunit 1 [Marinicaulis sp.]
MTRLLYFGKLADIAGGRMREIPAPDHVETISDLIAHIGEADAVLAAALADETVRYAVNEEIVSREAAISNTDEVAFLPPVSGG